MSIGVSVGAPLGSCPDQLDIQRLRRTLSARDVERVFLGILFDRWTVTQPARWKEAEVIGNPVRRRRWCRRR